MNAPNSNLEIHELNKKNSDQDEQLQAEYIDYTSLNLSFYSQEFDKWLNISLTYLLTFSLLLIWQKMLFPLYFCLLPSMLSDLTSLFKSSSCLKPATEKNILSIYHKRLALKERTEKIGSLAAKLLIFLHLIKQDFQISFAVIPMAVSTLVNLAIKPILLNNFQVFSEMVTSIQVLIITRFFRLLAAISLFLKIDGICSYGWPLVLLPVWIYLVLVGLVFLYLMFFAINLLKARQNTAFLLIGFLYLLVSILFAVLSFTIFFVSLSMLSPNFCPPILFLFLFATTTFFFKEKLVQSVVKLVSSRLDSNIPQVNPPGSRLSPFMSALNKPARFLVKLSSAYFKKVSPGPARIKTSSLQLNPSQFLFHWRSTTSQQGFNKAGREERQSEVGAERCLICSGKFASVAIRTCCRRGLYFECGSKLYQDAGNCNTCRGKIENLERICIILEASMK